MYSFDAKKVTAEIIQWIREYFQVNGKGCKAVVGISGGKDSSVVAALCTEALGANNVIGVLMPQGEQFDINYSEEICQHLGIKSVTVNIGNTVREIMSVATASLGELGYEEVSTVTRFNTPARIRMTTLYAISGTVGGRVANTCNLSEDWVGYATKYGDGAGDFSPLMNLTVTEVRAVGRVLGIPEKFITKTPIDGLCGMSDEENLGFTYDQLDLYIRQGICDDEEIKKKIDHMNTINLHKLQLMPNYKYKG